MTSGRRGGAWRRAAVIGLQVAALGAGLWFLVDTARDNWPALQGAHFQPVWPPLLLASLLTAAAYVAQVRVWVHSLTWWHQRLPYFAALRIWFVSNLARFIPGIVWQFAGVAAMVREHRVSPVAAAAGIVLQQLVLTSTGVVLTAAVAPAMLGPWAGALPPGASATLAVAGLALVIAVVPRLLRLGGRLLERMAGVGGDWPLPSPRAFGLYVLGLGLTWPVYGLSFWLFARAVLPAAEPLDLPLAATAFVASYVVGLLAVFAPAGLVVREAALVAILSPSVGGGPAFALAVGSRLWLVALELLTAAGVLIVHRLRSTHPPSPGAP
ncbi:MAG TPA: hypothetical protein VD793_09710 [Gemmatimonadales bacterium]|nr:hypothetical protein [Gemmatimonadales bacterium]